MSLITYDEFVRAFDTYHVGRYHVRISPVDETRVWRFLWDRTDNCNPRVTFANRTTHTNYILVEFKLAYDSQAHYLNLDICTIC